MLYKIAYSLKLFNYENKEREQGDKKINLILNYLIFIKNYKNSYKVNYIFNNKLYD